MHTKKGRQSVAQSVARGATKRCACARALACVKLEGIEELLLLRLGQSGLQLPRVGLRHHNKRTRLWPSQAFRCTQFLIFPRGPPNQTIFFLNSEHREQPSLGQTHACS